MRRVVAFGENVFHRIQNLKMTPEESKVGIQLGRQLRGYTPLSRSDHKVIEACAIQRLPLEERWSKQILEESIGTPWNRGPSYQQSPHPARDTSRSKSPQHPPSHILREGFERWPNTVGYQGSKGVCMA